MEEFLEPIFLNEKMVLNTAAYLFKGVMLEEEVTENHTNKKIGKASLGLKFLQDLISPISASGEINSEKITSSKSARIYTLGGLHMSVIDELKKKKQIESVSLNPLSLPKEPFVSLEVILKPVDFYQILEVLSLIKPLIVRLLSDFGTKLNSKIFTKNVLKEIPKYDKLIESLIQSLVDDYLKSKQLEMLMISPETNKTIGIVDIDLLNIEPLEIKAKLNDGQFKIIGKVSRYVEGGDSISLLQRTVLSKIMDIANKLASIDESAEKLSNYKKSISKMQPIVEKFIKLNLPGPAIRVIAMSINV